MIAQHRGRRIRTVAAICLVLTGVLAVACAYPESRVETGDEMAAIMVIGAPEGARLIVDGIDAGPANEFSKDKRLSVLPGRHVVRLAVDGRSIAEREVHVGAGSIRTIEFTGLTE